MCVVVVGVSAQIVIQPVASATMPTIADDGDSQDDELAWR